MQDPEMDKGCEEQQARVGAGVGEGNVGALGNVSALVLTQ